MSDHAPEEIQAPPMPSDDEVEKRAYRRLPRPYPVEVARLAFPMDENAAMQTTCCDISTGGLSVEAPADTLKVGDVCRLKVHIPLLNTFSPGFFKVYENDVEQYFTALGQVVWTRAVAGRILMGCTFVNVDADQRAALEKLITKAFAMPS